MEYGTLIKTAYRIALRNPRLWPFGVLAGTGGGFNFSYSTDDGSSSSSGGGSIDIDPAVIVALVAAGLVLFVILAAFAVLSQGALAEGVVAADRGEARGFRQGLRAGRTAFWRLVGLYLLLAAVALGLVLVVAVPVGGAVAAAFLLSDSVLLQVLVVVLAVLAAILALVLLLLPLAVLYQHAIRLVVLERAGPRDGLRGGWSLLRANLGPSILVFLIQQGLQLAGYLAVGIAALILCVPAIAALIATGGGTVGIIVAAITALVVVPVGLVAAGAVGTFGHALWTLGWLRMSQTPR